MGSTDTPTCAECGSAAELVSGARVYPRRKVLHDKTFWLCACGAYVGCHPGTSRPLGTPAGKRLRRLRVAVHARFDPLWRRKIVRDGCTKREARGAAYAWLSEKVGTPVDDTHIGKFNIEQCERALAALEGRR